MQAILPPNSERSLKEYLEEMFINFRDTANELSRQDGDIDHQVKTLFHEEHEKADPILAECLAEEHQHFLAAAVGTGASDKSDRKPQPPAYYNYKLVLKDMELAAYCYNSATFRRACTRLESESFRILWRGLTRHRSTVIAFCQIRGVLGAGPLRSDSANLDVVKQAEPHDVFLDSNGAGGSFRLRRHGVTLGTKVLYDEEAFRAERKRPSYWPTDFKWPQHPQIIRTKEKSPSECCKSLQPCACTPESCPLVVKPLVQLQTYPGKGVGVKCLQNLVPGQILEEYIGDIVEEEHHGDYDMTIDGGLVSDDKAVVSIAKVNSQRYGNWTRFLNHCCGDFNVKFDRMIIGRNVRIMCVVVKPIRVFDELTSDYGRSYFNLEDPVLLCQCGTKHCKYNTVAKIKKSLR